MRTRTGSYRCLKAFFGNNKVNPPTQIEGHRFLIRRDGWLRPLLFLVGLVRDSNSYVAIEGDRVRVRFGWFFNQTFALSDIDGAELMRSPWY